MDDLQRRLDGLDHEYHRLVRSNLFAAVANRVSKARLLLDNGRPQDALAALATIDSLDYYGTDPDAQRLRQEAASIRRACATLPHVRPARGT